MMKKIFYVIIGVFLVLGISAGLYAQTKKTAPWCTPPLSLGATKEAILSTWGEPDIKKDASVDDVGISKETWVYYSYPPTQILAQHSYVCRTFYLTFTGDNLTNYKAGNGTE